MSNVSLSVSSPPDQVVEIPMDWTTSSFSLPTYPAIDQQLHNDLLASPLDPSVPGMHQTQLPMDQGSQHATSVSGDGSYLSDAAPEDVEMTSPTSFSHNPADHMCYQSPVEFEGELRRHNTDRGNPDDKIFLEWVYPWMKEQASSSSEAEGSVHWGSDATFGAASGSASTSIPPTLSKQFTHLQVSRELPAHPVQTLDVPEHLFQQLKTRRATHQDVGALQTRGGPDRPRSELLPSPLRGVMHPGMPEAEASPMTDRLRHVRTQLPPLPQRATPSEPNQITRTAVRPREKLNVAQKRRNHIRHEQRRRAVVKEGLDELMEIIPDLADRNLSKSALLLKAADWLENLVAGNKALAEQIKTLESGESGGPDGAGRPWSLGHRPLGV